MKHPETVDLISLFECEPINLAAENTPFFYDESTYKYTNSELQTFEFIIYPCYNEVSFVVTQKQLILSKFKLFNVNSLTILSDKKTEKRLMITSDNYIIKISLKPFFNIEFIEEKEI